MAAYGERSIEAAVALTQRPEGMALIDLAAAMAAPLTSAQRAAGSLIDQGLAAVSGASRRIRLASGHPAAAAFSQFALRRLPAARAMAVVCRANRAVEFAGQDGHGVLVVLSPFADPADVALLQVTLELVNADRSDGLGLEIVERSELRERLLDEPDLRTRGIALHAVKGRVGRTFRDPFAHGSPDAPRLGRLHPSLRIPSAALSRVARRHHLASLAAFGSAVRSDFSPDSDVDVLVEPAPGTRLRAADLVDLRAELETLFDRDVDLVRQGALDPGIRDGVLGERVVLYGPA
jgi:predicted nucleotidyltransferase